MVKGAFSESFGLAYPSRWMTGDLFAEAINYFINFIKVMKSNPGVLYVKNKVSQRNAETFTAVLPKFVQRIH